jgi:hypothetical protein
LKLQRKSPIPGPPDCSFPNCNILIVVVPSVTLGYGIG